MKDLINKIHNADCLEFMKKIPDNSVDSIVTDPPYEIGFMGKSWDNTGIANNPKMWAECLRVLKPGGFLLSFSGTRNYHRMACAIEDAGFEIRDMIEWVYGSGFPKSFNIGKAVDKLQGNERKFVCKKQITGQALGANKGLGKSSGETEFKTNWDITKGDSEYEGWGTALKPAHEPICMARKPLAEKTVAENCLKWGTGGINVELARIDVCDSEKEHFKKEWDREQSMSAQVGGVAMKAGFKAISLKDNVPKGRFPANLILDKSEEVKCCFPNFKRSSSRFFKSIFYVPKVSQNERNNACSEKNIHPTVKPLELIEYLIKMVTPKGGLVLDPFAGSGTTLVSAKKNSFKFIGIELTSEYMPIIQSRLNNVMPEKQLKLF